MTDISPTLHSPLNMTGMLEHRPELQIFADGCHEPKSGHGGWAFVAYRDVAEIATGFGGVRDSANNMMELMALLKAALWINENAIGEPAIIWSDSDYAVNGCTNWLPIWKNNGWRTRSPNGNARSRKIANSDLWKAIDLQLSENRLLEIDWCKGHSGIHGNERADALADSGRRLLGNG
jgi:ribonuclease HI